MGNYVLLTDSCCDLSPQMAEELNLLVQPLSLTLGGQVYRNWLDGREIGFSEFYARIRGGEEAVTSVK